MVNRLLLKRIQLEIILQNRGDRGKTLVLYTSLIRKMDLTLCAICGTTSLNYVFLISSEISLRATLTSLTLVI